ncbi:MAG: heavy metal-associated domain-containing protein [Bacillota bacterium]|nr:heavy metal-associated domain-containing protein [Bacillota bacterium]
MKKTIQMEELVCPMCAQKIETALQKVKGVSEATVLYNASKAKIEFDENETSVEALKEVITQLGYVVIK